jgi:tetratricopeptide (TPR) repeat protein
MQYDIIYSLRDMPSLCLTMIVKNEEKIIERLLTSVLPIIDTYCICDTGSTDSTVDKITNFFEKHTISGTLNHHEFINFSHNRNLALTASLGISSHILLMDADMVLQLGDNIADLKQKIYTGNCFAIFQGNSDYYYKNTRIIKNDGNSKYVGSTHEYISTPYATLTLSKTDIFIHDIGDGGCKKDKFERDIRLLTKDLELAPNNERNIFYLANSYFCIDKFDDAIPFYQKRIELGGWDQEIWYSYYRIGLCHNACGRHAEAIYTWLKAFDFMPGRIENIYEIIKHYRITAQYSLALLFITIANDHSDLAGKDDFLFLNNSVYTYKIDYEFSIIAYYLGETEINNDVVRILNNNTLDLTINQSLLSNLHFYPDIVLKYPEKLIPFSSNLTYNINGVTHDFISSSACLLPTEKKDGYWLNIRFVNYRILKNGSYTNCDNYIITINQCNKLSLDFNVISSNIIEPQTTLHSKYMGIEDVRICLHKEDNKLGYIGTNYNTITNQIGVNVGIYNINDNTIDGTDVTTNFNPPECEKNWVFIDKFITENPRVVYKWNPLQIGEIKTKTGILDIISEHKMPNIFSHVRGSTCACDYTTHKNTIEKWFIGHLVAYGTLRNYYHIFMVFDENMHLLRYSAPFKFSKSPIEYCLSILVNSEQVVIPYSTMDCTTDIAVYNKKYIDALTRYFA